MHVDVCMCVYVCMLYIYIYTYISPMLQKQPPALWGANTIYTSIKH